MPRTSLVLAPNYESKFLGTAGSSGRVFDGGIKSRQFDSQRESDRSSTSSLLLNDLKIWGLRKVSKQPKFFDINKVPP